MAQDAGQAGARWADEDWLAALNILIDYTLPREARMATYAQVLAQVAALMTERERIKAAIIRYLANSSPATEEQLQAERDALAALWTFVATTTPAPADAGQEG